MFVALVISILLAAEIAAGAASRSRPVNPPAAEPVRLRKKALRCPSTSVEAKAKCGQCSRGHRSGVGELGAHPQPIADLAVAGKRTLLHP